VDSVRSNDFFVLSQVQDDQLGKDIKCLVEIFQNNFIFLPPRADLLPFRPFPLRRLCAVFA
jgi:hypothetical protein